MVDLHTHSTASDGQYTPEELIRLAKEKGIDTLALTDHDTIDGLPEAAQAGKRFGVQVLRGYVRSNREAFDRFLDTEEYDLSQRWPVQGYTSKKLGTKLPIPYP